jgi:hypothetical protein
MLFGSELAVRMIVFGSTELLYVNITFSQSLGSITIQQKYLDPAKVKHNIIWPMVNQVI